jgi:lysophospholipase L1-like esterase
VRVRGGVGRIALSLGGVLVALALAECGVRIGGVVPERFHRTRNLENADKSAAVDAYPTNPRGYFDLDLRDAPVRARLGALGLDVAAISRRAPYAVELHYNAHRCRDRDPGPLPPGTTRIVVLGDSFTEGEGVREGDTFSRGVERSLRAEGHQVEVLNCGERGRDFPEMYDAFVDLTAAYEPSIVVYAMVLNDAVRSAEFSAQQAFLNDWILDRRRMLSDDDPGGVSGSRLWALVRERIDTARVATATTRWYIDMYGPRNQAGWDATKRYLAKMHEQMDARHGRFLVALLPLLVKSSGPYPFAGPAAEIRRACAESNIPFVDLGDSVRGEDAAALWVHPVDMHPNARAHALFAASLHASVVALLPPEAR